MREHEKNKGRYGLVALLPVWSGMIIAAASAAVLLWHGRGDDGIRAVLRLTAHTSASLFCASFAASSLVAFTKAPLMRALLRARRQVGLSFAVSHTIHLGAIISRVATSEFRSDPLTIVTGFVAYTFIALMSATSNDRAVRALGAPAWKRLHWTGSWFLWGVFAFTYAQATVTGDPVAAAGWTLLLATAALRYAARRRRA